MKKVLIILFVAVLISVSLKLCADVDSLIRFVFIPDLNLYPTPSVSQKNKHAEELKRGILLYENQAIFQDIVRYINLKIKPDVVVLGGNSIFKSKDIKLASHTNDYFQLFLDMASEIKSEIFLIFGINEMTSRNKNDLISVLNSFGLSTNNYYWSKEIKEFLFIGLDSELFFLKDNLVDKQLNWLDKTLSKNQRFKTIIFLHKSLISPDGYVIAGDSIKKFFEIVTKNPQVILILSGSLYLNRVKILNNIAYVLSPSPVVFPCSFREVEISKDTIYIKSVRIPLKGIVRKAEVSLKDSEFAKSIFPESPKKALNYVLGTPFDANTSINISDLRDR